MDITRLHLYGKSCSYFAATGFVILLVFISHCLCEVEHSTGQIASVLRKYVLFDNLLSVTKVLLQ